MDLLLVKAYPFRFPTVTPADLDKALAVFGDQKGAGEHVANLGITDPETALHVRAAFGAASGPACKAAKAAGEEIHRHGLGGISADAKATVAQYPDLFPSGPERAHNSSAAESKQSEKTR